MCGIIGYVGEERVVPLLLEGLKRLEYRGYDSAGISLLNQDGSLDRFRKAGKVRDLESSLDAEALASTIGIGHTRWATHGAPTERNAHPHTDCHDRFAVIHNGIIENFLPIKNRLLAEGHIFDSDTDTEVLAHLVASHFDGDLVAAVTAAVSEAEGAFALAVLSSEAPDRIAVARRGSPLVLGHGDTGSFVCSDIPALLGKATSVQFLADDEVGLLTREGFRIFDMAMKEVVRPCHKVTVDPVSIQKGGYKHFMLKEIHEQSRALSETVREKAHADRAGVDLSHLREAVDGFDHIYLVACGTAYHAAMVAEYLWEQILPVPIQTVIASEFRMRSPHLTPNTLVVAVSQSGETIDTLMAIRHAREQGARIIALVNNEQSAIDREADGSVYTRAGIEIGVAATKTFTAQIAALGLLGLHLAERKGAIATDGVDRELRDLALLSGRFTEALRMERHVNRLAERLHQATDMLFLARGVLYPIALEGALKMKEISYIHAEGYPAGEMKHGPIALIDSGTPVVLLLSKGIAYDKVVANMEEVKARDGHIIAVTDAPEDPAVLRLADDILAVPQVDGISRPILYTLPLQLLAYYVAVWRGTDVDQPRNLAKTVTVE